MQEDWKLIPVELLPALAHVNATEQHAELRGHSRKRLPAKASHAGSKAVIGVKLACFTPMNDKRRAVPDC